MRKAFIFILALVAGAGTLFAESGELYKNIAWDFSDGVLTISYYDGGYTGKGEMKDWKANEYPWYNFHDQIEAVQITNDVINISANAFTGCKNLTYVGLGKDVKKIGASAFQNCTKLTKITFPSNVQEIGSNAFRNCTSLSSVRLSEGVKTISQYAFAYCTSLSSITIPSTVKKVEIGAFEKSTALETVCWNVPNYGEAFPNSWKERDKNYLFPYVTKLTFGDKVERIPENMCIYYDSLQSVTFGKNVQRIEKNAFYWCHKLNSVTFNENLKVIGEEAFYDCVKLKRVIIPDYVDTIGYKAFDDTYLSFLTIGEEVNYIYPGAFYTVDTIIWNVRNYTIGGTKDLFRGSNATKSFSFGENVERIPFGICSKMRLLQSITIPESVKFIGEDAFEDCSNLKSVIWNARNCQNFSPADDAPFYSIRETMTSFVFGDKVESIPSYLCYEMSKLTVLPIPASVTSIGNHAFDGCSKWAGQDVVIPNNVETIGEYAFANCNLATITIGSKVNSIGKYAFMGNDNMTSVSNESETPQSITANVFGDLNKSACDLYVPEASISAYKYAAVWEDFRSFNPLCRLGSGTTSGIHWSLACSGKLALTGTGAIPNYTTYLGDYYQLCTAPWFGDSKPNHTVKSAEISDGITRVGNYAFWQCQDMTDVYIPNTVTSIGEYAFYYNKALKAVTLSDNIESIGQQAFTQCTSLTSLTLPIHLKSIESTAFALCSGLTSVVIPDEVEAIRDEAFAHCINLTELTIPASVTTIDVRAFTYCTKLTAVWNKATTPQKIESNVFGALDKSKCKLYVPKNAVAAYMNAPVWKEFDIQTDEGILASGTCGAQGDNLMWTLTTDGLLTIVGTGEMEAFNQAPWYTWRNSILSVVIENGATTISPVAFMSCNFLSHVEIPSTVTTIGDGAFTSCYALSEITIPNSVKSLGNYTFLQCSSITSITIPEGVTTIGGLTFSQCVSLTDVKLPSTIKSLDASAFSKCASLTTITLPASITTIGVSAFAECYALESVTNEAVTPQTINPNVFDGLTLSNICLFVPESAVSTYKNTAVWKDFSPIVPIGTIPTAVDQANSQELKAKSQKLIRDGQLLIERDGKIYTLMGQIVK